MTQQMLRALTLSAVVFGAAPVRAQTAAVDPRWQAYIGCWIAETGATTRPETPRVCVVPSASDGRNAVTFITVVNNAVVDRTVLNADGQARASNAKGCTGTETLEWSRTPGRLYFKAAHLCEGGLDRNASGIIALSGTEWVDIRRVTTGPNASVVRSVSYRPLRGLSDIPAEVVAQLPTELALAVDAARVATSAPLTIADVIDASRTVDAPVVEAWLAERQQRFDVSAKMLRTMADAKVPASTIDVVVAVSYPQRFHLEQPSMAGEVAIREAEAAAKSTGSPVVPLPVPVDPLLDPYGAGYAAGFYRGAYGNYFGAFGYDPYVAYSYSRYSPYSTFSPYNYYSGSRPVVVYVTVPNGGGSGSGGSASSSSPYVDRNKGYTQGTTSTSTGSTSSSSGASTNTTSSGSSGSSGSTTGGTGGAPPPEPPRTAKPRGGGGG